jgi:hypothetical protein
MASEFSKISLKDIMSRTGDPDTGQETVLKVSNEIQRKDIVNMTDSQFFDRVTFAFENNKIANAFFINEIEDKEFSDLTNSDNVFYDIIESAIKIKDPLSDGEYISTSICTDKNYHSDLNSFFIIADEDIPAGCDILYYLITDDDREFPIKPNATEPLTIKGTLPQSFRIKMIFHANGIDNPGVRGFAVLYHDQFVEDGYGLINPKFTDLGKDNPYNGFEDIITLVRDPLDEDKLKEVIGSLDTVKLIYDHSGRLAKVETYDTVNNEKQEENDLVYGDYLNSEGVVEEVLLQVRTKTSFTTP